LKNIRIENKREIEMQSMSGKKESNQYANRFSMSHFNIIVGLRLNDKIKSIAIITNNNLAWAASKQSSLNHPLIIIKDDLVEITCIVSFKICARKKPIIGSG
jgi:hypothetical protein